VSPVQPASGALLVVLTAAGRRYGLHAHRIIEIVPAVPVQPLALAPACVTGILDHHGTLVPVIDLGRLLYDRPCERLLGSRIVIVLIGQEDPARRPRRIGLLAEACALRTRDDAALQTGLHLPSAPFLGPLVHDDTATIQMLDPERILPPDILDSLLNAALDVH
jgi:chemotaxis-related protein WspB